MIQSYVLGSRLHRLRPCYRIPVFTPPSRLLSTMASPKPRIWLVLDWDGTMTTTDTTAVIGSHCIAKARELAQTDISLEKLPKDMQYYSDQYFQQNEDWKRSHEWIRGERKTVEDEVAYLSQSKHAEQSSYLRVRNAVLNVPGMADMMHIDRMRNDFMMEAGRQAVQSGEVRIREPAILKSLIAKAEESGNMWGVVSVNWSRSFILGALLEAELVSESQANDVAKWIRCNELLAPKYYDDWGRPFVICSALDKQKILGELLTEWEVKCGMVGRQYPVSARHEGAAITIYVGDSITDLGCLAGPAIGMYLSEGGKNGSVTGMLEKLHIPCLPISELPSANAPTRLVDMMAKLEHDKKPPHLVCRIGHLHELNAWISALR